MMTGDLNAKGLTVALIGIAGTSRDFLLSLPTLKAFVMAQPELAGQISIGIYHSPYIKAEGQEEACREIAAAIADRHPVLVGFSVYVWNVSAVCRIAALVTAAVPDVRILFGGPEISSQGIAAGRFDPLPVDYLICGEGELPFARLLAHILRQDDTPMQIPGVAWRTSHRFLSPVDDSNPLETSALDMAGLPSAYLSGAVPREFWQVPGMRANIETQRGCNLRCAYCLYHKGSPRLRYRPVASVMDEIDFIHQQGVTEFRITDANFFSSKKTAKTILQAMMERRLFMSLFLEVIPFSVDEEMAELIGRYIALSPKCRLTIGIGLQSINKQALRAIRRNIDISFFDRSFSLLAAAKAIIKTDVILGLPFETKDSYLALLDYVVEKMRYGFNYLSLSLLRVLPGSDMEEVAARLGLMVDDRDGEHFVFSTPSLSREELVSCLRLNAVAFRLFSTMDQKQRLDVRDRFFVARDRLGIASVSLLERLAELFRQRLDGTNSDFLKPDFPNAESYCANDVFAEIPEAFLLEMLDG